MLFKDHCRADCREIREEEAILFLLKTSTRGDLRSPAVDECHVRDADPLFKCIKVLVSVPEKGAGTTGHLGDPQGSR